jgi:UDP-glucose 4-epimerase
LRELLDRDVEVEHLPARAGDYLGRSVSAAKARDLLGWEATTSFRDGLDAYVAWFRSVHPAVG